MAEFGFVLGSGSTAVLLIHGLTGTPVEMRRLGRTLAAMGYTAYGVRLAGHCGTEADLVATGWKDWYRSVEKALDAIRERHEQVVVGGLSMGALLALRIAAERASDVAGVLLYSTTLFADGWTVPRYRVLMPIGLALGLWRFWRFVERPPYGLKDERVRHRVLASMLAGDSGAAGLLATPGAAIRELERLSRVVRRDIPRVTCPALVVHAAEDDVCSRRNADVLAARLGGDVTKVLLRDSYHMVLLDREKERVAEETARFLGRVAPSAAPRWLRVVGGREADDEGQSQGRKAGGAR